MKEDKDIISLMFQKLGGTISPVDDAFLNDRLLEDEELRVKWKNIEAFSESQRSRKFLERINEEKAWANIEAQIETMPSSETLSYYHKYYFPAAAVFIIMFALSLYVFLRYER